MNGQSKIEYEDGWQSVSVPEYPSDAGQSDEAPKAEDGKEPSRSSGKKDKSAVRAPLLAGARLIICLVLATAAFMLKSTGAELYDDVREWYDKNLNSTVIFDGGIDISGIFSDSSADEVQN